MPGQGSGGNVIAAICSFFIAGLGQLVQGRLLAAILFFVFIYGLYGISFITLGLTWVIGILVHLWCIIDAARYRGD
ncbi:MAG: hypothetical protein AAGJ37_16670 [Pseudomonadota bacterium]